MELNSSQRQAVLHKEGPCLVIAGPGSGKTAVLTRRVNQLVDSGVSANDILVITFTKAAAIEMKERFNRLSESIRPVTFGTFHSLFWGILQKELGYKASDIIMGNQRTRILREALSLAKINTEDSVLVNAYFSELSNVNNSMIDLDSYSPKYVDLDGLKRFIRAYEFLKDKYKVLDFDDMLIKTYNLFLTNPQILSKWQHRFSYFLVDEMQDMNDLQFKLIRMLSSLTDNLFCVGDDDQSIYGFRGANPKIMQDFMIVFPEATKIILDHNYRNPKNVVEAASKVIARNSNRFVKDIKSTGDLGQIAIVEKETPAEEAEYIINEIKRMVIEGIPYQEIAVLYRNHSDARYLVDALVEQKLPFYLKEQIPNVYSHFIIADIESYFQIAVGNCTKARMLSILNRPNRFLHRQCVAYSADRRSMLDFYQINPSSYRRVEALWSDIDLLGKMSPVAAINYIRKVIGYDKFLYEEALKKEGEYEEYLEVLDFIADIFKDLRTLSQAIDRLNMLKLKIDYENKNRNVNKNGKIGLYTLHSSKGLEFDTVFILSCNDGVIPTNRVESKEDIEAERRLFYVGITRCKKHLYLTYNNKKNRDKSRFLDEMCL
ncbi:DNA helicase-2 / ATP-dependent DNA helicase PcrA [Pseudobutyrivibrio sp. YE44]|uniref:ATP-dependent helicase n=1 Tax=Pseudobutyrivibrio sp. YE44 TaxID=1520802 RepID=UPI00088AC00E|nr:ATP-dependent helicase [Pseudobutyrivibrio sp. YE44]SDB11620.1 DNA helicase-2 / ATP-dependent DNA helicase PcrA [Pseudobutyrivibrio sp. YE44]